MLKNQDIVYCLLIKENVLLLLDKNEASIPSPGEAGRIAESKKDDPRRHQS